MFILQTSCSCYIVVVVFVAIHVAIEKLYKLKASNFNLTQIQRLINIQRNSAEQVDVCFTCASGKP